MAIQDFTNSSLVSFIKISPNKTVNRNHVIDTISIHCVVGQASVESLGTHFAKTSTGASSNYGIGYDGRIGMYVEEKDRSWCTSSSSNDHRAITIEVASDAFEPYAVREKPYKALIELLTDICRRNNIKELKWKADKSLIGKVDKQNMTVHRWFSNKSCPGDYLYERHGEIARLVNEKLGSKIESGATVVAPAVPQPTVTTLRYGSTGTEVKALQEKLNKLGYPCGNPDGVFGNQTLSAVKNFQSKRKITVDGVVGSQTYLELEKALDEMVKQPTTVNLKLGSKGDAVKNLQTNLNKLGYSCGNPDGDFGNKTLAAVKQFQTARKIVVDGIVGSETLGEIDKALKELEQTQEFKPYLVKTTVTNLNIRKGPGTNYATNGTIHNKGGAYTIVEEATGQGATKWLKLKSGAGWIASNYTAKI